MIGRRPACALALGFLMAALALAAAPSAGAKMVSSKLGPHLCETTGGGRIVDIPGFPGERIDRRLLADIRWLRRRYPLFITDGYSNDPVHSANGEHPLGLALDIVPHPAAGAWRKITALAGWAEPQQNAPRTPFRWVGYDGDSNHGRGHHLHLSWSHSVTKPGRRARTVYTLKCPRRVGAPQPPPSGSPAPGPIDLAPQPDAPLTGGTGAKPAPPAPETGGVSAP